MSPLDGSAKPTSANVSRTCSTVVGRHSLGPLGGRQYGFDWSFGTNQCLFQGPHEEYLLLVSQESGCVKIVLVHDKSPC